jgi:hypothetical protein
MSKTAIFVSEIVGAIALTVLTYGAGSSILAAEIGATASSTLFSIGVAVGITGVFGLLQPLLNPQDTSVPGSQQNAKESAAFRRVIYGEMETGGVLTYDSMPAGGLPFQDDGPTGNWRHQIYTISGTPITSFGRNGVLVVVIDDVATELQLDTQFNSGYYVPVDYELPYGGKTGWHIGFEFDTGDPSASSAFPLLSAACNDWTPGKCIQKGCAKVHVAMRYDYTCDGTQVSNFPLETIVPIYGNGRVPTLRFPVTGKPIVDTRNPLPGGGYAVATNPRNPALIVYDWLLDSDYGEGADPDSIDVESVNAAANICEESVCVYITQAGNSIYEMQYLCDGVFDQAATRGDVLKSLLSSMAGTVIPPGDLWHVFAGAYNPPSITLTDADLRGPIKGDFRISRRDLANGIKGTFIPCFLPTNQTEGQPAAWRWTDFPPYQGNGLQGHPNYIAEDGGQIIWKDVRFGFTTSIWMVQRLAKILLQMLRFQVTLHLACKLTAFPVQAGDTITFIHERWASLETPAPTIFFVTQATLVADNSGGALAWGVDLVLRETDPSVYQFTPPSSYANQGEYSQYGTLGTY